MSNIKYKLTFSPSYYKRELDFLSKNPDLNEKYYKLLKVLEIDPHYPSLRLHKLKGKLKEFYSVSINMEYRLLIDFIINDKEITLIDIGGHEIYK